MVSITTASLSKCLTWKINNTCKQKKRKNIIVKKSSFLQISAS